MKSIETFYGSALRTRSLWMMPARDALIVCAMILVSAAAQSGEWTRNTFPSQAHKASKDFPPYAGEYRSQALAYFGASDADPNFMITAQNMCGEPLVSTDGRSFVPRGN